MKLFTFVNVLRLLGLVLLLFLLYRGAVYFSAWGIYRTVRRIQDHFCTAVYPRQELAAHLRDLPVSQRPLEQPRPKTKAPAPPCPAIWIEREDEELMSPYYLRTGRQVSRIARGTADGTWYDLDAWVLDVLASRVDALELCRPPLHRKGRVEKPAEE